MGKMKKRTILANNLIRLRKKHGLTQEELSKLSGVSRRTIALYETRQANPPIENIEKLAKALNTTIEKLIDFSEDYNKLEENLSNIDSRTLKKFIQILSLTPEQRHMVYAFVDSLTNKNKKKAS